MSWSTGRGQGIENLDPNALFGPSHEPIVERLVRAIIIGCINPPAAGFQNVHNAADDAPVVNTRLAAGIRDVQSATCAIQPGSTITTA